MVTLDDLISPDEFVELRNNHSISNERIEYFYRREAVLKVPPPRLELGISRFLLPDLSGFIAFILLFMILHPSK